jgi:hypothetical protein
MIENLFHYFRKIFNRFSYLCIAPMGKKRSRMLSIHQSPGLQQCNRTDAKITKLGKPSSIFKYIYKNKGEPE